MSENNNDKDFLDAAAGDMMEEIEEGVGGERVATTVAAPEEQSMAKEEETSSPELKESAKQEDGQQQQQATKKKTIPVVPWVRQLWFATKKNWMLMVRRPFLLACMCLSSCIFVLLASIVVQDDPNWDFGDFPLTQCGTAQYDYIYHLTYFPNGTYIPGSYSLLYDAPLSYNDGWRNGLAVTIMAMGPMCFAICVFLLVQPEVETQMLGVLRSLGLRESVYWASWWLPLLVLAFINAILGAAPAAVVENVHAFQHISYGSVFSSLFFLTVALISPSFLLVAMLGSKRSSSALAVILMVVAVWVPYLVVTASSVIPEGYGSQSSTERTPIGLFFKPGNTTYATTTQQCDYDEFWQPYNCTVEVNSCESPLMTDDQARTEEERMNVSPDEFFLGCYFLAGFNSYLSTQVSGFGRFVLYMIPYTEFMTIWSNFIGYTAILPDRSFGLSDFSLTAEELARASIGPQNESNGLDSDSFSQGTTFLESYVEPVRVGSGSQGYYLYNCPIWNQSDYMCENRMSSCDAIEETHSFSASGLILTLMGVTIFYQLLAVYWIQVFPSGNGAAQPYYFPFLARYWTSGLRPQRDDVPPGAPGVFTNDVSKVYGENHAVDTVNVSLAVGEVTAMLGHNGAGKTTLSHILCCETLATSGTTSIFGFSAQDAQYVVRQLVGICKQDDYLYPNLSAREHLELFAGLRGVDPTMIETIVQEWLESVDLALVQNQNSSGFSGGMKRRLSVACSTIGDRPFIILDEPTTGMDPVSRRFVWKHVDSIKAGRVVLLTTHAMEEADLLADTVIIMSKGQVAASGSPLALKKEHGSSLQFSLMVDKENLESTTELVRKHFASSEKWVKIEESNNGTINVTILKVQEEDDMDGIAVESLADFATLLESGSSGVREYGFSNSSLEEVFLRVTKESHEAADGEKTDVEEEKDSEEALEEKEDDAHSFVIDDQGGEQIDIGSFEPRLTLKGQCFALLKFFLARDWVGKSSIGNWVTHSLLLVVSVLFSVLGGTKNDATGYFIASVFTLSICVMTIALPIYYERQAGLFYMTRSQGMLKWSFIGSQTFYAAAVSFIFTALVLCLVFATPLFRPSELCNLSDYSSCEPKFGDVQKVPEDSYEHELYWYIDEFEGKGVRLYARRTPGGFGLLMAIITVFPLTMPGGVFSASYIPGYKLAITLLTVLILGVSVVPLIFYFVFNMRGGREAEECMWDICNTTFTGEETALDGEEFLNCVGLEANANVMGALCIPSSAGLLPQFGVFQGLTMLWMNEITFWSNPPGYAEAVLIPKLSGKYDCSGSTCQFPYARDLFGSTIGFMALGAVMLAVLGFLFLSIFSFPGKRILSLKTFFHKMIWNVLCCCWFKSNAEINGDDTVEVRSEVLSEQDTVKSFVESFVENSEDGAGVEIRDYDAIPRDSIPPVLTYKLRKEYPLSGGFSTKLALKTLDIHVPKGQVLGLLGKNGAGKTTALKILSGAHDSTSGLALVAGYDVSCELLQVFERLGNCPQFDVVWPQKSIKVHLEFFGGLKGIPQAQISRIAQAVASSVGLGAPEVYSRNAGALSGGMRRRLSIAISLIGAPSVLLLDEPTTGLDPSTRNTIWDLISSFATEKRAIIITTHMMLEADTLCSRIAIMAKGSLKTIGTQQWLKNTYGSGYLLQLNLTSSDMETQDRAMSFVKERLHPGAVLQTRQAKTLLVALPQDVSLGDVFRVLYSSDRFQAGCINQFLFSQSSLEDVFISQGE